MEQDFIVELENKVNGLIGNYTKLKENNDKCLQEMELRKNRIGELEGENGDLRNEIQSLKDALSEKGSKLDKAAEKVKELISKLATVA